MNDQEKILILVPDLNIIGGKANYYSALKKHYATGIEYFTYGPRIEKLQESKPYFIIRLLRDYLKFYRKLKKNNYNVLILNPSLSFNSIF